MKTYVKALAFLMALLSMLSIKSQDIITLLTSNEITCKVIEVTGDEIKYRKKTDGPLYIIKRNEVFFIKYKDGTKEIFTKPGETIALTPTIAPVITETLTVQDLKYRGRMDARRYYNSLKKTGAIGTLLTSAGTGPLFGLIPATICSIKKPNEDKLMIPKSDYMNNPVYFQAYTREAYKKKSRAIWGFYGLGVIADVAIYFIISGITQSTTTTP